MPHLVAADEAHLVNTSSVNGFWASMGRIGPIPPMRHTRRGKGFSEALITDLRIDAHVKVSVVMPGTSAPVLRSIPRRFCVATGRWK